MNVSRDVKQGVYVSRYIVCMCQETYGVHVSIDVLCVCVKRCKPGVYVLIDVCCVCVNRCIVCICQQM